MLLSPSGEVLRAVHRDHIKPYLYEKIPPIPIPKQVISKIHEWRSNTDGLSAADVEMRDASTIPDDENGSFLVGHSQGENLSVKKTDGNLGVARATIPQGVKA